jgi:hypothetical protein
VVSTITIDVFRDIHDYSKYMKENSAALFALDIIQGLMRRTQELHGNTNLYNGGIK